MKKLMILLVAVAGALANAETTSTTPAGADNAPASAVMTPTAVDSVVDSKVQESAVVANNKKQKKALKKKNVKPSAKTSIPATDIKVVMSESSAVSGAAISGSAKVE